MTPFEFLKLVRRPRGLRGIDTRRLERCVSIEDLHREAARYLPRSVLEFVDGGAEDESALRENRGAFERLRLLPGLADVSAVDLSVELLGEKFPLPFALAPTGGNSIVRPDGELVVARAAHRAGIPFTAATMASVTLEESAAEGRGSRAWFQLYGFEDRGLTREIIARARSAGYRELFYSIDTPTVGARERDMRNGMTLPPSIGIGTLLDGVRHPRWSARLLASPPLRVANIATPAYAAGDYMRASTSSVAASATWRDLEWIAEEWGGPVSVKGVLSPSEARHAVAVGARAIVVSNHGGRQLDAAPASIAMLPEIRDVVDGRAELLLDSGIRRGADIVKALALGASGCLIGRPYLYGLAVAGEAGVARAIGMLAEEVERTMKLIGAARVADITVDKVRTLSA